MTRAIEGQIAVRIGSHEETELKWVGTDIVLSSRRRSDDEHEEGEWKV